MSRWFLAACGLLALALAVCACGNGPDGSCYTDFDCETNQVCGLAGMCLQCTNCERGQVGTCTAPVWPRETAPDSVRIDTLSDRERLIYAYTCPGALTEYRYHRINGERCFERIPHVDDGCGLE